MAAKDTPKTHPGISRRGFLKGVGAGAAAAGFLKGVHDTPEAEAQSTNGVLGPDPVKITLNINGQNKEVEVEPRVTLLDALRNRLDLTGSKKVCDRGTCGACTVMVDDKLMYSCSILAVEAQGRKITTVEGLGNPDKMNDVQTAFVEHDGLQCGFCTPGFVVATTAYVKEHPNASEDEVRHALGGNLCRCGTYAGIHAVTLGTAQYQKGGLHG